ncbi:MAG: hypothetical protein IT312_19070 [Anaerolineales bacterium]|nr:hypothetical protein [Anaerolineales bacterium]
MPIPFTLAPFFQEYDLAALNPQSDSATVIERTLLYGTRAELKWLFTEFTRTQIRDWVTAYAKERLPNPHRTFWRLVLDVNE